MALGIQSTSPMNQCTNARIPCSNTIHHAHETLQQFNARKGNRGTFWVFPLTYIYLPKMPGRTCCPNLSSSLLLQPAAAPWVLTSFVHNQNTPMQQGSNAPMHQCPNAPMHQCTNAPMHQCTNAPMHHAHKGQCTNAPSTCNVGPQCIRLPLGSELDHEVAGSPSDTKSGQAERLKPKTNSSRRPPSQTERKVKSGAQRPEQRQPCRPETALRSPSKS